MSKLIDLTGQTFDRLTVISRAENNKANRACWHCYCICGNAIVVSGTCLRKEYTKSCGCLGKEKTIKRSTIHGLHGTPEYRTWQNLLNRCRNQKINCFKNYGGRGIKVCNRWSNSFELFLEDMGKKPTDQHSIERINNNGNYEPDNCYWGTPMQQAHNKRNNHNITFKGETHCLSEWSRRLGGNVKLVYRRLKRGWPESRAVSVPRLYKWNTHPKK